jgi:hypothetical protein
LEANRRELLKKHEVMSSDELPRFLDEELHRVDAFELEEPQSLHDLLLHMIHCHTKLAQA